MKKFTSITDVSDLEGLLALARELKSSPFKYKAAGENKTLGLLFFNPSLRTRLSTQKAAMNLGMDVIVMNLNNDGWSIEFGDGTVMNQGTQEHIKEAAGVVSQYCDIIGIRTFASLSNREEDYQDSVLEKFIKHSTVPVVSLESARLHPLQSLADLITIAEHKTIERPKVVLTWAPHPRALPQSVSNSFVEWVKETNVDLTITHPVGYELKEEFTQGVEISYDQEKAFENADFIYAKNWSCYRDYGNTLQNLDHWVVNQEKMQVTNNAKFMHCLPIRRNVIATDQVLDAPTSLILEQANNRTFAAQAVLLKMLRNED